MKRKKPFNPKYRNYSHNGRWASKHEGNKGRQAVDAVKRFKSRLTKLHGETGCWIWQGKMNKYGRGQITYTENDSEKTVDVRKFSIYLDTQGEYWPNSPVKAICGTYGCVNPKHLKEKKRTPKRAMRVFTDEDVRAIRQRFNVGHESLADIRQDYPDVSDHSIYCAATYRTYKKVL